ncbi:MAG: hypothetical protein IT559_02255 [Alphaproteobacteria bacterium]|nr:hypothetical protein [Alphaproteobacteria bacterium]
MTIRHLLIAGIGLCPFFIAANAQADYGPCREYSKTISIGGRVQIGYGQACRQPDGAWEIISISGAEAARPATREYIRDDLYALDGGRVVIIDRPAPVVYREPVYYYAPAPRVYARPVYYSSFWGRDKKHDHHYKQKKDRHGHGSDRNRGRGHRDRD